MSTAVLKHNSVNKTIQMVSLSFGITFELKLFAGYPITEPMRTT